MARKANNLNPVSTHRGEDQIDFPVGNANSFATYAYDALGRRIAKSVQPVMGASTDTTFVLSRQWQVLDEIVADGTGSATTAYVFAPHYVDEVIAQDGPDGVYYYTRDYLYSVVEMIDATGTAIERYAYDAYGERVALDSAGLQTGYGLTGHWLDAETGSWHFRARFYDPQLGRFLIRDSEEYVDGLGLYQSYFIVNWLDPTGLWKFMPGHRDANSSRAWVKPDYDAEPLAGLEALVKLDAVEAEKWLYNETTRKYYQAGDKILTKCDYSTPNKIHFIIRGTGVMIRGKTEYQWFVEAALPAWGAVDAQGFDRDWANDIQRSAEQEDAYGFVFVGHGGSGLIQTGLAVKEYYKSPGLPTGSATWLKTLRPRIKLGFIYIGACHSYVGKWDAIKSAGGHIQTVSGTTNAPCRVIGWVP